MACQIVAQTDHTHLPAHRGRFTLSPQPSAKEIHKKLLKLLLDPNDEDRAYVKFEPTDEVVLLCNNMGGMSSLEMNATVDEAAVQLENDWNIKPVRIIEGSFVTAMNMPGMSITLLNVTQVAKRAGHTTKRVLELLDAPHGALAYPNGCVWQGHPDLEKRTFAEKCFDAPQDEHKVESGSAASLKGLLRLSSCDLL